MSLYNEKEIHRDDRIELTIDNEVVNRVEKPEKVDKQPNFDQYTIFQWSPETTILGDMIGNEDKGSVEENPEYQLEEETVEEIYE